MRKLILLIFMIMAASQLRAENRVKVAVIDTGISFKQSVADYACKDGHKTYVDDSIYSQHKHGINIISIISKTINPNTHCIKSYKVWTNGVTAKKSVDSTVKALRDISRDYNVRFLNISMGGPEPYYQERVYIKRLLIRGVQIVVAAGNEKSNLDKKCDYFPACYKQTLDYYNFYVVKSQLPSSNHGKIVTDTYTGSKVGTPALSGTSQAAAQKMQFLLKSMVYSNRRLDGRLQQTNTSTRKTESYW